MSFQFPAIGQTLTQPTLPSQGASPPQEQMGLWQSFRHKLQTDPNFKMALMTTGLNMMRTPDRGKTGFDTFADAATGGVNTLDQLRQRDRTQEIEASDTQFREEATTTSLDQGEQRIGLAGDSLTQRADQFDESLAENIRQFDERNTAGDFSPAGSGTTGAERILKADILALQKSDPETYPNTPEGQAKARLTARDMSGLGDKQGQARLLQKMISDIRESNAENVTFNNATPMTEEQILQQALVSFRAITQDITTNQSPFRDEQPFELPGQGQVTPSRQSNGRYKLVSASGQFSTEDYSLEELKVLRGN